MVVEHDRVVVLASMQSDGLVAGDVGTVVHCYADGQAYEVEFVALDGHTTAVVTIPKSQIRPVNEFDMAHARELHPVQ